MIADDLGRSLYWLASKSDLLNEMLFPRQASSGENAGKPPARRKSKPPLVVDVADFIREGEDSLGFWCGQLVAACPSSGPAPSARRMSVRAAWLSSHIPELEGLPWVDMMAQEVGSLASVVRDLVDPPPSASDPEPIEEGTSREVERWLRILGVPVHRRTIQRWVEAGLVQSRLLDDGRVVILLREVLELAKHKNFINAPPHAVS